MTGESGVHPRDRLYRGLHLAFDRSFRRQWATSEIFVDVPCPLPGRLRHHGEQRRSVILETDGGKPPPRDKPAAARNHRVRPLGDQRAFPTVDLDAQSVNVGLELLVANEPSGSARERLSHACLEPEPALLDHASHLRASTFRLVEAHPAVFIASPSHPE